MANFAAHIDEGIVFTVLAVWWMFNIFKNYIQRLDDKLPYRSYCSYYSMIKGRRLPLELILKITFPLIGLLAEVFSDGHVFMVVHKDGHIGRIGNLHHISIFALFVMHGISDLLEYAKLPVVKGIKYFTFIMAFLWYGVAFFLHSFLFIDSPVEVAIHRLPILLMLGAGIACLFEYAFRDKVLPQVIRTFFVFCLGVWVIFSSFVLFLPTPFPGFRQNPAWDRKDEQNAHFLEAMFGFFLTINIGIMLALYFVMVAFHKYGRQCTRKKSHVDWKYTPLQTADTNE